MINPGLFIGKELLTDDPVFEQNPNLQRPQNIQAQLTVVRGSQNGAVFRLFAGTNLFGRIEGLMLRYVLASRRHMQIEYENKQFFLEDLRSTNGTYLNGKPVTRRIVWHHGDVIRVGETIMTFELPGSGSAVLGYGAAPQPFHNQSSAEVTNQTRMLHSAVTDKS